MYTTVTAFLRMAASSKQQQAVYAKEQVCTVVCCSIEPAMPTLANPYGLKG